MARFLVDVQLEILIVIEESAPLFKYGQVERIPLFEHIKIVSRRYLRPHFNCLTLDLGTSHRQSITPPIYIKTSSNLTGIQFKSSFKTLNETKLVSLKT